MLFSKNAPMAGKRQIYAHNMPIVYAEQAIEIWMQFFTRGISPQTLDIVQPGSLV